MKLYVVPTNQVQRFWYLAEPLLQKALEKGNGEFTAGQLKLLVTQGQQQLLLAMEQDICYGAATVQWISYPNDRVAYITYLGGKNIKEIANEFKEWVKQNGGTSIQCSTKYESIAKLLIKKHGYYKKYQLLELRVDE